MNYKFRYFLFLFACITGSVSAGGTHPNETAAAIRALLASANQVIPSSSTCYGAYFAGHRATVKDLVAIQLAYLQEGENAIHGSCVKTKCSLEIRHANGEDVSSASISFAIRNGAARASSLACIITP